MMRLRTAGLTLAAVAALMAGCASPVKLDETPIENRDPTAVATRAPAGTGAAGFNAGSGVAAGGAGSASALASGTTTAQSSVATVEIGAGGAAAAGRGANPGDGAAVALGRVVYFDFDSFVVKEEFRGLVEGHARALIGNKQRRMVIEGHTDERGGREYNLALGQKRAEAVLKSLTLMGVGEAQLEAVSFGKERPVAEGHDEAAWAQNRRAELKDR